jgi:GNAT superfamily N-acetyltransferase
MKLWKLLMDEHTELEPTLYKLSKIASKKQQEFFSKNLSSKDKFFVGCFEQEKLIGYALGRVEDRPPVLDIQKIGVLSEIVVLPEYRRQGVGKQLAQRFFDWCKEKGVKNAQLHVLEKKDAVKFYKELGFRDFMKRMIIDLN